VRQQKHYSRGFSLVELAMVLALIGVIVGASVTLGQAYIERIEYQTTDAKLDELVEAMKNFHRLYGRLPCPAARTLLPSHADFGKEVLAGNCASSTSTPTGTSRVDAGGSNFVRIGTIPVRDMGLDDLLMRDEFGQRFTYAVMQNMTQADTLEAATGAITVNDGTGHNIATDIAYVIVSHGKDGRGGHRFQLATVVGTCGSAKRDHQNCNNTATFTDSLYNAGQTDAVFFDDRIRWRVKNHITEH
jgi:prepilin-type N-terminal cleavage/methylation domain-containing protein